MRLRAVAVGVVLVCGSLGSLAADAAEPRRATVCQGHDATIIGEPRQKVLRGTPGDDVIVTNGADRTLGRGGDDLICTNGRLGTILEYGTTLDAGPGDDIVDSRGSGARAAVFADLGPGDDRFVGGNATDVVTATNEETLDPEGSDTISTGDNLDSVETGSGDPLAPDTDTIDLGPVGDDLVLRGATDPSRPVEGGDGSDIVYVDSASLATPTTIDNAVGALTTTTATLATWTSFSRFQIDRTDDYVPPAFVGGDGRELVDSRVVLDDTDLGGGDDELVLSPGVDPETTGVALEGGDGTDRLYVHEFIRKQGLGLDLATGALTFGRDPSPTPYADVSGFEKHDLSATWVDFRGSRGADQLRWNACYGSVSGWKGDDHLAWSSFVLTSSRSCRSRTNPADVPVHGNDGDDVLTGGGLDDVLVGGRGDDTATGRRGEDRCRAETKDGCER